MNIKGFFTDPSTIKIIAFLIILILVIWLGRKYFGWFKSPKKCSSGPDCGEGYVCIDGKCVDATYSNA